MTDPFPILNCGSAEHSPVLLADDHPAMLALRAHALAVECFVVGSVGDGCELLAEAERLNPDVFVLDITMTRLSGIKAAHRLQRLHWPARLAFLTVREDADFAQAASMREGSALSLRRGSLPTSCLPSG